MGSSNQERITGFPQATGIQDTDILYLVQDYVSPTNPGLSTYATLSQILTIAQNTIVTSFAGDPNGNLAGTQYGLCWDTANEILYVCTTTGNASTAVWTPVTAATPGGGWIEVTSTSQATVAGTGYTANNAAQVVFTLPLTCDVGDKIEIQGFGAGGWRVNSGSYTIRIGSVGSTPTTGYIESGNRFDSIVLVCAQANSVWTCLGGPQGNIVII